MGDPLASDPLVALLDGGVEVVIAPGSLEHKRLKAALEGAGSVGKDVDNAGQVPSSLSDPVQALREALRHERVTSLVVKHAVGCPCRRCQPIHDRTDRAIDAVAAELDGLVEDRDGWYDKYYDVLRDVNRLRRERDVADGVIEVLEKALDRRRKLAQPRMDRTPDDTCEDTPCEWTESEPGVWYSGCGDVMYAPPSRTWTHCPHCGSRIQRNGFPLDGDALPWGDQARGGTDD